MEGSHTALPQSSSVSGDTGDLLSLRNILMATDFSECSARALSYALGIAARYEARLHLFHCLDLRPYNMVGPDAVQSACDAAWRDMQQLESVLRSSGLTKNVEVTPRVEAGDLAEIIPQIVSELDLGLIVAGTHGRTGWRKMVLGSVTEVIVDQASCPALIVGPSTDRTRLQQFGPENILLASGLSARSKLAEAYAFSLARKYDSRLTVVDVLEDRRGRVVAQASQLEWCVPEQTSPVVEKQAARLLQLPSEVGECSDLILRVADKTGADLIVLAVPAGHRFTDRFLSTNSYRVVCGAPSPVLTVRAQ